LTTTNGTQAIHDAMAAGVVLAAAMPNRRAVARRAAALGRRIVFVSAGTVGTVSCEDTLVAGAVIDALLQQAGGAAWRLEDSAHVALAAWQGARGRLAEIFHRTWGGAFIANLGLEADLDVCIQVDTTEVVPLARGDPPVITAG
jgi:2-phosphosulfolactate phosphatase